MAKFIANIPTEIINDMNKIYGNADKMLKEMTQEGAKTVYDNIRATAPSGIRKSKLMKKLKRSKAYNTPSDDGVATKVAFFYGEGKKGYYINHNGKNTPIPVVLNMFEFGSSKREYPKQPFIRKSFKKNQIENAMKKVQKKYLKGTILDNE